MIFRSKITVAAALALIFSGVFCRQSQADAIVDATEGGYYLSIYSTGSSPSGGTFLPSFNPFSGAWLVGWVEASNIFGDEAEYRSFFEFDLSGMDEITAVIFEIELSDGSTSSGKPYPGYNSPDAFETIKLASFDGDITQLSNSNGSAASIWQDLGSGDEFGSLNVSASDQGTVLEFTLNSTAIDSMNVARLAGDHWALGVYNGTIGAINSDALPDTDAEVLLSNLFAGSSANVAVPRLNISTAAVPEPSSLAVLGMLGLLGGMKRRRF